MVFVPAGAYYLGDPDTTSRNDAAFFGNTPNSIFEVKFENQVINIGSQLGQLNYRPSQPIYQGDRQGPVPASFPKGVQAFYIQKYEISQGAYASFLNTLGAQASYFRSNFGGKDYYKSRGSLNLENDRYAAKSPNRPLNFVSWDDGCAFADWAGLRPMTELEFEKACRGPEVPIAHQFPWGTGNKKDLARYVDRDDELKLKAGIDEAQLSDQNRAVFAASYWWVMDLAGSLWERVVSIGHPAGRAFKGSHGDGRLSGYGYPTNDDWPRGDDERNGGYGYRGGGYYEHGKPETDFNPHSPISWRNYAAWAGGPRSIVYGFRCVRTAP
jgi:formylglycine-generating enzyme required for sulfatase activity